MNAVGSLIFGGQTFFDASGVPLANGYLKTTLAGLSTLASTFSDVTLSTPNLNSNTLANTLRLNSAGRANSPMYFSPVNGGLEGVAYDLYIYDSDQNLVQTIEDITVPVPSATGNATSLVLGFGEATTLTIAGGSVTPIHNIHKLSPESGSADNLDNIAVTNLPDGAPLVISNTSGSAAITVRNGVGNIFTGSGNSVVLSGTSQRLMLARYGANWFQITTPPETATLGNGNAQGRLTLTSGVPVTTADVLAATSLYYTPYNGNTIDLYDGVSSWTRYTLTQLTLSLTLAIDGIYDVFVYNNAGTLALQLSSPWVLNVRVNAIGRQNGVLVLSGDTRLRYVGTISATGVANQTEDSQTKRYVWNYYHRVPRPLNVTDATASWTYSTATFRQANAAAGNKVATVIGVVEDPITLTVLSRVGSDGSLQTMNNGIGLNSTSVPITTNFYGGSTPQQAANATSYAEGVLNAMTILGRNEYVWLEKGVGSDAQTWYGNVTGLHGSILG